MSKKIFTIDDIKSKIKENEQFLQDKFNVRYFLLFGSYAKGNQTADSDIDLLVEFKKTIDMFDFIDLQEYLQNIFGKKVDLGTKRSLKRFIKKKILDEAIAIWKTEIQFFS